MSIIPQHEEYPLPVAPGHDAVRDGHSQQFRARYSYLRLPAFGQAVVWCHTRTPEPRFSHGLRSTTESTLGDGVYSRYTISMPSDNEESCSPAAFQELLDCASRRPGENRVLGLPQKYLFLTGDANSALMLSQLMYWSERTTNPDGWVFKSLPDWKRELNLNRRTLEHARLRLKQLGLIETSLKQAYRSPTTHYRVCREALEHRIASMTAPHLAQSANFVCTNQTDGIAQNVQMDLYKTAHSITESTPEITSESTDSVDSTRTPQERACETATGIQMPDETGISHVMSLQRDASAGSEPEPILYEILERLPPFLNQRDSTRLHEVLRDYSTEASALELKKFVEYWRTRKLKKPLLALRNWLDRIHRTTFPPHVSQLRQQRQPSVGRIPRELPQNYSPVPVYGDEVEERGSDERRDST